MNQYDETLDLLKDKGDYFETKDFVSSMPIRNDLVASRDAATEVLQAITELPETIFNGRDKQMNINTLNIYIDTITDALNKLNEFNKIRTSPMFVGRAIDNTIEALESNGGKSLIRRKALARKRAIRRYRRRQGY